MTLTLSINDSTALLQALVQHIRNAASAERANQSRDLLSTLVRQLDQHGHAIPIWASRELQERVA